VLLSATPVHRVHATLVKVLTIIGIGGALIGLVVELARLIRGASRLTENAP